MKHWASSLSSLVRIVRHGERGSAAVEFAILLPLFLSVLFSGFEAGMMYLKIGMMEHGVSEISRKIYTGKADGDTRQEILDIFCDAVDTVLACDGNVTLEVRRLGKYTDFDAGSPTCTNSGEELKDDDQPVYSNTNGGDIVFIRVCMTTNLLVPALKNITFSSINAGLNLPETAPGQYSLSAATVIRNEPF